MDASTHRFKIRRKVPVGGLLTLRVTQSSHNPWAFSALMNRMLAEAGQAHAHAHVLAFFSY